MYLIYKPLKDKVKLLDFEKSTIKKMQFFDYLNLAKINGEWKIVNVLWAKTK